MQFFDKWDKRRRLNDDEDPEDDDMTLEKEFQMLTGHKVEVDVDEIRDQMDKGVFNYDSPTQIDVRQSVLNTVGPKQVGYDDNTDGPFQVFIRRQQYRDTALTFVKECLDHREAWPSNDLEIK